ncbi:MAG TPA: ABC transporter substrate-binding protein [Candidatus Luteococcus avicola]|nr:ABC transporter substrate-binding protein [Candidatus Luteococcus avicola]
MSHTPRPITGRALAAVAAFAVVGAGLTGCSDAAKGTAGGGSSSTPGANANALLTIPREDMGTFSKNFNPFSPNVAPMTQQAIYEPLFIYNPAKGDTTPWLATEWKAGADNKSIEFTLRDGVKWSDGKPLVADDVVTTFTLFQKLKGAFPYVSKVAATGTNKVTFTFSKPYSPGLYEIGQQIILPDHVWKTQADPDKYTNPAPVGTGPYTQVDSFQSQSYVLKKNPNYWQPDKQKIAGIKMLAFAGNDGANLAAVNGDVDWAPQYIPNIEKTYIAKDKDHRHYWFPPTGSMINLQLNTTKAPFDDVAVRKAISTAIDRDQVVKIGMSGYTKPADCTGLSGAYETWKDDSLKDNCTFIKRDVELAKKSLEDAGYKAGPDGKRTLKDGKTPFTMKISVGSTSSDWVSVSNVISQNLADVGIAAKVDSPDWAAVTAAYEQGKFDSGIVWSAGDPTPYQYYLRLMGTETVKPVGTQTFDNYHRFADKKADQLLAQFTATTDEAEQHEVVNQLQKLYQDDLPVVPLFPGPEWGAYTDVHFTGWPSEQDPYATLSTRSTTTVKVLTTLQPR